MKCPQGMTNATRDNCIILKNSIHDLVQVAQQYYEMAVELLKKSGFVGGNVNPCHYLKKGE